MKTNMRVKLGGLLLAVAAALVAGGRSHAGDFTFDGNVNVTTNLAIGDTSVPTNEVAGSTYVAGNLNVAGTNTAGRFVGDGGGVTNVDLSASSVRGDGGQGYFYHTTFPLDDFLSESNTQLLIISNRNDSTPFWNVGILVRAPDSVIQNGGETVYYIEMLSDLNAFSAGGNAFVFGSGTNEVFSPPALAVLGWSKSYGGEDTLKLENGSIYAGAPDSPTPVHFPGGLTGDGSGLTNLDISGGEADTLATVLGRGNDGDGQSLTNVSALAVETYTDDNWVGLRLWATGDETAIGSYGDNPSEKVPMTLSPDLDDNSRLRIKLGDEGIVLGAWDSFGSGDETLVVTNVVAYGAFVGDGSQLTNVTATALEVDPLAVLADGTRAMSGNLDMDMNDIMSVRDIQAEDVSASTYVGDTYSVTLGAGGGYLWDEWDGLRYTAGSEYIFGTNTTAEQADGNVYAARYEATGAGFFGDGSGLTGLNVVEATSLTNLTPAARTLLWAELGGSNFVGTTGDGNMVIGSHNGKLSIGRSDPDFASTAVGGVDLVSADPGELRVTAFENDSLANVTAAQFTGAHAGDGSGLTNLNVAAGEADTLATVLGRGNDADGQSITNVVLHGAIGGEEDLALAVEAVPYSSGAAASVLKLAPEGTFNAGLEASVDDGEKVGRFVYDVDSGSPDAWIASSADSLGNATNSLLIVGTPGGGANPSGAYLQWSDGRAQLYGQGDSYAALPILLKNGAELGDNLDLAGFSVTNGTFVGDGSGLTGVTDTDAAHFTAGNVLAPPEGYDDINVGALNVTDGLDVQDGVLADFIQVSGVVSAGGFAGDGSGLTNITAAAFEEVDPLAVLADGTRAMTGDLDMGGFSITNVASSSIVFEDGTVLSAETARRAMHAVTNGQHDASLAALAIENNLGENIVRWGYEPPYPDWVADSASIHLSPDGDMLHKSPRGTWVLTQDGVATVGLVITNQSLSVVSDFDWQTGLPVEASEFRGAHVGDGSGLVNLAVAAVTESETDPNAVLANGTRAMTGNLAMDGHWVTSDGDDEGVFVAENGNVGIGTAAPSAKLNVQGGSIAVNDDNGTAVARLLDFIGGGSLILSDDGGTNHVLLVSNGGGSFFKDPVTIGSTFVPGSGVTLKITPVAFSNHYPIYVSRPGVNAWRSFAVHLDDQERAGLYLFTNAPNADATIALRAEQSSYITGGNVGIGTTNPLAPLHVAGNVRVDGELHVNEHARFLEGIVYIKPAGNLSMGIYTNMP